MEVRLKNIVKNAVTEANKSMEQRVEELLNLMSQNREMKEECSYADVVKAKGTKCVEDIILLKAKNE